MPRTMVWTLRQRRYQAFALLMLVMAIACVAIGTFEIHRLKEKIHGNDLLRANAHAATTPLTTTMVPLTGDGPAPGDSVKFCTVSVTGRFDVTGQEYVAEQNQSGYQGFYVLTPLRTSDGVLLVARGFIPATADQVRPDYIPGAPTGTVRVVGRLYPTQTTADRLGVLGHGEITSIDSADQAARLGAPVYQAYLALDAGQPGVSALIPVPKPDLSNPTGGAGEIQLLSYVVQWYVFAVLALLAPFFFARAETKDAQRRYLGIDPDGGEFDDAIAGDPSPAAIGAGSTPGVDVVPRAAGTLARPDGVVAPRLERAQRLADRYGRSFGPDPVQLPPEDVDPGPLRRGEPQRRYNDSAPFRSDDGYHGSYNDHLWQLALADGEAPDVEIDAEGDGRPDVAAAGDGLKVYGPAKPKPDRRQPADR